MSNKSKPNLADWLGFRQEIIREDTRWLGHIVGVGLKLLGLVLVGLLVVLLIAMGRAVLSSDDGADIRNIGLVLAALIGAPFVVWRSAVAAQQAETAAQGMITDRINQAVEGLGAEKTVNRLGRTLSYNDSAGVLFDEFEWIDAPQNLPVGAVREAVGRWQDYSLSVPNLEVRTGAIYALERISQDSPRDHIQIMEILCAYIRENAKAEDAIELQETTEEALSGLPPIDERMQQYNFINRFAASTLTLEVQTRARAIPVRTDIQAALSVIGRRTQSQILLETSNTLHGPFGYQLDLRGVSLQGADLAGLQLARSQLAGSRLDGADLSETNLANANLNRACLQGAKINDTNLKDASLRSASLRAADLGGTDFTSTNLESIDLRLTLLPDLSGKDLSDGNLSMSYSHEGSLAGANLTNVKLESVHFEFTNLAGCRFDGIRVNGETRLDGVRLSGTGFRAVDLSALRIRPELLEDSFCDGTVTRPLGATFHPESPLKTKLERYSWSREWRAWQKRNGYASE